MIKQLLIAGLLVMILSGGCDAEVLYNNGSGTLPSWCGEHRGAVKIRFSDLGYTTDYIVYYTGTNLAASPYYTRMWKSDVYTCSNCDIGSCPATLVNSNNGMTTLSGSHNGQGSEVSYILDFHSYTSGRPATWDMTLYYNIEKYTISGNLGCIESPILKLYKDDVLLITDSSRTTSYSYDIIEGFNYTLMINDYEYEFTCTGDITHNLDMCAYITLDFKDNCGNLLPETWGRWYTPNEDFSNLFHTSSGSYDILYDNPDYLELQVFSAVGKLYYNITSPQDISYTILNDKIAWYNNIYVRDGNTSMIIEDALVMFSQDCIIDTSLYPVRQKYSNVDGYACFDQCELDMAYITVTATGYKPLSDSISPIHLDAFNLGQTTIATLYPVDDPTNESAMTESGTIATTYIYFKDNSSYHTNSILDTNEYVDLYYYNNNSESAAMTLKFQKYNVYTGLEDLLSWNIPHNTDGYKRIYNANFTDHTYSYYGYLYNVEIDGWNRRTRLSVRNETKEIVDHYQNLSTNLWFENKNPQGDIDYREDISVIAYANSDNSSLLEISLELYNNSIYVDHINLTWADFIGADTQYYYEWKPDHAYADGHNYTVRMHGYDYYLLRIDFINASDFRKNKLTIIVKDRWGSNLDNAYVFLEGYGSLSTGISYYNSYEGLDNGDYRYKASKSGYSASGWDSINLTNGDEIVCYVLTSDTGNTTYVPKKFDDTEIKLIFFPLMFFLLIMILIGGFKYVSN